jgi:Pyruvate/2-oxoacid:ferredoxin oxidoreductase delta subunit
VRPVAERVAGFDEVQLALDAEAALAEAGRCFSCGTCIYCDKCYLYCPDMAVTKLPDGYSIRTEYCKGCGLCVKECPTGAIQMRAGK